MQKLAAEQPAMPQYSTGESPGGHSPSPSQGVPMSSRSTCWPALPPEPPLPPEPTVPPVALVPPVAVWSPPDPDPASPVPPLPPPAAFVVDWSSVELQAAPSQATQSQTRTAGPRFPLEDFMRVACHNRPALDTPVCCGSVRGQFRGQSSPTSAPRPLDVTATSANTLGERGTSASVSGSRQTSWMLRSMARASSLEANHASMP